MAGKNSYTAFPNRVFPIGKIPKKIKLKDLQKSATGILSALLLLFIFFAFQVYIPINPFSKEVITYAIKSGSGADVIAKDLKNLGLIRSDAVFKFYLGVSLKIHNIKAGKYNLSPNMSAYKIAGRIVEGDVVKNNITIIEGWKTSDIDQYLTNKEICKEGEFTNLSAEDYSREFNFLNDKPRKASLEGYLFPDTYEIADGDSCSYVLQVMLSTFGEKLTQDMRDEIKKQKKTIFDIITMASIIEKEVHIFEDQKMVSGVLWNRIDIDMPLQVDCTINYITGKSDAGALIKDTKIDSPYNTYKYKGLPKGPIANPGINAITAAIYPTENDNLYYLSNGKTYFSKTLDEHNRKKALYLK